MGIAGAEGLTVDSLADVVTGVTSHRFNGMRSIGSCELRFADGLVEALPMQAHQHRVRLRYGEHLSPLRRAAIVLFASSPTDFHVSLTLTGERCRFRGRRARRSEA